MPKSLHTTEQYIKLPWDKVIAFAITILCILIDNPVNNIFCNNFMAVSFTIFPNCTKALKHLNVVL